VDRLRRVGVGGPDLKVDLVSHRADRGRLGGTGIDRRHLRQDKRLDLEVGDHRLRHRKAGLLRVDALLDRPEPGMLQARHRGETDGEGKRRFHNHAHGHLRTRGG
jgi:hypothetical protein